MPGFKEEESVEGITGEEAEGEVEDGRLEYHLDLRDVSRSARKATSMDASDWEGQSALWLRNSAVTRSRTERRDAAEGLSSTPDDPPRYEERRLDHLCAVSRSREGIEGLGSGGDVSDRWIKVIKGGPCSSKSRPARKRDL